METVDVVFKLPKVDGYEYTGEIRFLEQWDSGVSVSPARLRMFDWQYEEPSMQAYFILRKLKPEPVLPEWMPSGWWIAMDGDERVWVFQQKPYRYEDDSTWYTTEDDPDYNNAMKLDDTYASTLTIFDGLDWTECCFQKK